MFESKNIKEIASKALADCPEDKEVFRFMQAIQPSDEELQKALETVTNDLKTALNVIENPCHIFPYGSSTNGLFIRGSDIDLFVDFGELKRSQIMTGIMMLEDVLRKDERFAKITTATRGRCPILTVVHKETGLSVDVNFSASTSIYNNYLIKHFLNYDSRIKPLFIIIKSSFKYSEIFKASLTNFNLYCLLIYFLQNLEKPLLPPIKDLLNREKPFLVENRWNINFNPDFKFQTENQSTLLELVSSFFEFYSKFDFDNVVISTFMGNTRITKENFGVVVDFQCPGDPFQFKLDNGIMIQDFFMLNVKLGAKFSLNNFKEVCEIQFETIQNLKDMSGPEILLEIVFNKHLEKFLENC